MKPPLDFPSSYRVPEDLPPDDFSVAVPADLRKEPELFPPLTPPDEETTLAKEDDPFDDPLMRPPKLGGAFDTAGPPEDVPPSSGQPESDAPAELVPAQDKDDVATEDDAPAEQPPIRPPGDGKPPLPPDRGGEGGDMSDGDDEEGDDETRQTEAPEGSDMPTFDKEPARQLIREPQTKVTGPFEITEAIVRETDTYFRHPESCRVFDGQVEMTDERWQEIESLQGAVRKVAEEVGIDVSDRLLPSEEHHIFLSKPDFDAAIREAGLEPLPEHEGQWNKYGLFMLDTGDRVEIDYKLMHETVHSLSRRGAEREPASESDIAAGAPPIAVAKIYNGHYEIDYRGGSENHAKAAIDEMVADMITVHATAKYVTDNRQLMAGYGELVTVGFKLIEGAAELHGEEPMEILRQLERGQFTDDETGLQKVAAYMGERNFRLLGMISPTTPSLAYILNVPGAVERVRKAEAGEGFVPSWLLNA